LLCKRKKKKKKKKKKNKSQSWPAQVLYNLARTSIQDLDLVSSIGVPCVVYLLKLPFLKTTVRP